MHIANCSGATKKPRFLVHPFFFLFPFSFNHSSSHPSTPSLLLQHHRERPASVTILPLLGDVIAVSLSASRQDPHSTTVTAAIFFLNEQTGHTTSRRNIAAVVTVACSAAHRTGGWPRRGFEDAPVALICAFGGL